MSSTVKLLEMDRRVYCFSWKAEKKTSCATHHEHKKRKDKDTSDETSSGEKKRKTKELDGFKAQWKPNLPEGETEETQEVKRKALSEIYEEVTWKRVENR